MVDSVQYETLVSGFHLGQEQDIQICYMPVEALCSSCLLSVWHTDSPLGYLSAAKRARKPAQLSSDMT